VVSFCRVAVYFFSVKIKFFSIFYFFFLYLLFFYYYLNFFFFCIIFFFFFFFFICSIFSISFYLIFFFIFSFLRRRQYLPVLWAGRFWIVDVGCAGSIVIVNAVRWPLHRSRY
jgi:hypothetical protein